MWQIFIALYWMSLACGFQLPPQKLIRLSQFPTVGRVVGISQLKRSSGASIVGKGVWGPRLSSSTLASDTLTDSSVLEEFENAEKEIEVQSELDEAETETETEGKKGLVEEIKETIKKYGVAGVLALAVEVVAFNILILLPASLIVFHQQSGLFIPTPATTGKFYGALGSVYLFCKFPPIEAARLAITFKIIPWVETKMPDEWRNIDLEQKWKELMSSSVDSDSLQK